MKMFRLSTIALFLAVSCLVTFGVAYASEVIEPITNEGFLKLLLESVLAIKEGTLSTLAIVGLVVKVLLAAADAPFFDKAFSKLAGGVKLTIVLALTLISGVTSLMLVDGLTFGTALIHSSTLSAFVVLSNQIYKQYFEKKKA